jgi:hypothetical protein
MGGRGRQFRASRRPFFKSRRSKYLAYVTCSGGESDHRAVAAAPRDSLHGASDSQAIERVGPRAAAHASAPSLGGGSQSARVSIPTATRGRVGCRL